MLSLGRIQKISIWCNSTKDGHIIKWNIIVVPDDGADGDLVVEGLAVQLEHALVHLDVVAAPGRQRVVLAEGGQVLATRRRHYAGLGQDLF